MMQHTNIFATQSNVLLHVHPFTKKPQTKLYCRVRVLLLLHVLYLEIQKMSNAKVVERHLVKWQKSLLKPVY